MSGIALVEKNAEILALLAKAKQIASQYYAITGRPLGVTGEIAEYEAIRILGLKPAMVRQVGYDAIRVNHGREELLQIKGRRLHDKPSKAGPKIGMIDLRKNWHAVLFVTLDDSYEALEIYEAGREVIAGLIDPVPDAPETFADQIPVRKFVRVATKIWARENGVAKAMRAQRPLGLCAGEFTVPDDFDAALPDDLLNDFEGK